MYGRRNRNASFSPTWLSAWIACVVLLPSVSMMGWSWFMLRSFVSWASVARSCLMAFRSALFPLPLSPVIRTMSVGFMQMLMLSNSVNFLVWSTPRPNASATSFVRCVSMGGAVW